MNSRIFLGNLLHVRTLSKQTSFRYPLYMLWLDLDELPRLPEVTSLFGHNRRRLLAVHDNDYLGPEPRPIREKLAQLLSDRGVPFPDGRVMMLTCARYLNYVFNPVSFYFGYQQDEQLAFAVAEVNNTFGEKHLYVMDEQRRLPAPDGYRYARDKAFHVSPFMDLAGHYDFLFRFPNDGLDITIDLIKRNQKAFHARLTGHFLPLTTTHVAKVLIRYPLTGFMTMTRITAQALKLYGKGVTVYERPAPASSDTIGRRAAGGKAPLCARLVLNALARIETGRLEAHLPDGTSRVFGEANAPAAIQLHFAEWRAFRRILIDGDIGLGESFMSGDWTTNDLTGFIRLLIDNKSAFEAVEDGHFLRQFGNRLLSWCRRNNPAGSRKNIAAHYDLSNDLFETFLDPSMTYSSAYFEQPDQSLEDAQIAKYRRLCEKAGIRDGDHVLEIGCGWGGFACFAARFADCRITAVTISKEQYEYARTRIEREGLTDRIELVLKDYRELTGSFDRIVSIEMFEAVGYEYYPQFFQAIERLLKPDGTFAMQTISIPDAQFENYRKSYDWVRKYIFPGGLLPSLEAITRVSTRHSQLVIQDLENIGSHYAQTLRIWSDRFNDRVDTVRALGFDVRFERMWNFYLSYCEAAFAARYLGNLQLVFARPQRSGDIARV